MSDEPAHPLRYFAYGSNMSTRQMAQRCPAARPMSRAVLHGHRLTFPRRGSNWPGGVAGIVADELSRVEGVVYEVTAACVSALDRLEGVRIGRYARRDVAVALPDGDAVDAFAYIAMVDLDGPFEPSLDYVRTMIAGAREHGLSPAHVAQLLQWLSLSA